MEEYSEALKIMYGSLEQRYQEQRDDMSEGKHIVKIRLGIMSIILGVLSFIVSYISQFPKIIAMNYAGVVMVGSLLPMFIAFIAMFWYSTKLLDDEIAVPLFSLTTNLKITGLENITTSYLFQTLSKHLAKTIAMNETLFRKQSSIIISLRWWNIFMVVSSVIPLIMGIVLYVISN